MSKQLYQVLTPLIGGERYFHGFTDIPDFRLATDSFLEPVESSLAERDLQINPDHKVFRQKLSLSLVGLDGNAFYLMGVFRRQARKEGWFKSEIDTTLGNLMKGTYDQLLATLLELCEQTTPEEE